MFPRSASGWAFSVLTAVLSRVQLPEEPSFCWVKLDGKDLRRQQLECRLLLLEVVRPVWHCRWAEGWMTRPSRPSVPYRL